MSPDRPYPGPYLGFQLKHIGDFLQTLPAADFLRRHSGRAVDLVVAPDIAPLARLHPWAGEVFVLDRRGGPAAFGAAVKTLRKRDYPTALIFDGQTRSLLAALAAGANHRLGSSDLYPLGGRGRLLTADIRLADESWPLSSQARRGQKLAAAALGRPAGPDLRPGPLKIPDSSRLKARGLTAELPGRGPLVGLALRGRQPEKSWPLAYFAEVGRRLKDRFDARLFAVGGPADKPAAQALTAAAGFRLGDFCGRTSLADLAALTEEADLFISVDTGVSHLAALTEKPFLAVYIWTSPALWPPLSPHGRLLVYNWALARFNLLGAPGPWLAAEEVTPELVLQQAERMLAAGQAGTALSGNF